MATPSLDEETTKKVIRQVEFYFSDSNLPTDDFLRKTVSESEDGTVVSLALICSFNRMRKHLNLGEVKPAEVTQDTIKAVAHVLRNSTTIKISEDGNKVGRITELPKPEEAIEQVEIRTIAASPFEYNVKLEEVESFFGQYGKINSVRLPRHVGDKKVFCGTALVEFSSDEEAEKILKQKLEYAGAELELRPKKDFDAERENELEKHKKFRAPGDSNHHEDNSNAKANYPKGLLIAFKLKSISDEVPSEQNGTDQQANENKNVTKPEIAAEESDQKMAEDDDNDKENNGVNECKETEAEEKGQEKTNEVNEGKETEGEEKDQENNGVTDGKKTEGEKKDQKTDGKFSAASYKDNTDVVLREDLKAIFEKFGTVKYIDFQMGAKSGYIRFEESEAAQKSRAAAVLSDKGGLVVKNFIATLDPVSGEAEKEYWSLLRGNQDKKHRDSKHNRGRGGWHGRGGKHGRNRDNESGGRHNKARRF